MEVSTGRLSWSLLGFPHELPRDITRRDTATSGCLAPPAAVILGFDHMVGDVAGASGQAQEQTESPEVYSSGCD